MANDYHLDLEGIPGESKDDKFKDKIHITSYGYGVHNPGSASIGGGAGTGRSTFQDMTFTKSIDKASPKLFLHCATGVHIPKATLFIRKAGTKQQEFYTIKMTDVLVSSWADGGHGEDSETFSLNFSQIEVEYKEQKPDGSLGGKVVHKYDLKKNAGS